MTIWVDAQLPPALAGWLTEQFGVEAANLDSVGLRQAQDIEIFQHARRPGHVIMTKDDDFVDIVTRLGPPPQILWVTCGNGRSWGSWGQLSILDVPALGTRFIPPSRRVTPRTRRRRVPAPATRR